MLVRNQPIEKPTLLLVDDDEALLSVLSTAMKKRGFSITTATSAESAFSMANEDPPEFAVVDLKMGGNSGLVLVRQ
ncbi:MAG: response regulator, partial [Methylotenera sp.]